MPHQCTNCGRRFPDGSKEMLSGCPDCGGNRFQFTPGEGTEREESDERERSGESAEDPGDGAGDDPGDEPGTVSRAAATVRDWMSDSGTKPAADATPDAASSGESTSPVESGPDRGPEREADAREPTDRTDDADEDPFAEWPETARPPEDRSDAETTDDSGVDTDWPEPPEEDTAQADARRTVVEPDELPERPESPREDTPPDHGRVVSEPDDEDQPSVDELRNELNEQFESIKIIEPGQYELNLMELYDREEHIVSLEEDGRYVIDVPGSWVDADE